MKNKDFKEILFGGKEKKNDKDDPTTNFLTGFKYSEKFYELLKTRKILPAWQAKQQMIELVN